MLYNKNIFKKIVYLNKDDYFRIHKLYADAKSTDYMQLFNNYDYNNDKSLYFDDETPYVNFTSFTLEDAINRSDIIPTIFYSEEDKIDFLDFMKTFETIDEITNKVKKKNNFVKKIRFDIQFITIDERRKKLEKKEYDDFIKDLYIFISNYNYKNPRLETRKQKYRKFIKKLLRERQKVGNYTLYGIYITDTDLSKIFKKCAEGGNKDKKEITIKNPTRKINERKIGEKRSDDGRFAIEAQGFRFRRGKRSLGSAASQTDDDFFFAKKFVLLQSCYGHSKTSVIYIL